MNYFQKPYLRILIAATSFALFLKLIVFDVHRVSSNSMAPTLLKGDLIFALQTHPQLPLPYRKPGRGDIVTLSIPGAEKPIYVKRVIAVGGDEIQIKKGTLYINGKATDDSPDPLETLGPLQVPLKHFFVLGDNRRQSLDSRKWGPLPYDTLRGYVISNLNIPNRSIGTI